MNSKSAVLINCRKINHQQKNTLVICKQLDGPILKALKPKWSEQKLGGKKIDLVKISIFFFRARLGSCQSFNFSFSLAQAQAEISISLSSPARLGVKF